MLLEQSYGILDTVEDLERPRIINKLLPANDECLKTLEPFLARMPDLSLMITNELGGALLFVDANPLNATKRTWDHECYSSAFRFAWFVSSLDQKYHIFNQLAPSTQETILIFFSLFIPLASDNISVPLRDGLWNNFDVESTPEPHDEALDILANVGLRAASWLQDSTCERRALVKVVLTRLLAQSMTSSTIAYYNVRAYVFVSTEYDNIHGPACNDATIDFKALRKSPHFLTSVAHISSATESDGIRRLCNELISEMSTLIDEAQGQ